VSLAWILAFALQAPVDDRALDSAVRKGLHFLKCKDREILQGKNFQGRELLLWAFAKAEVPASDPLLHEVLNETLSRPPETTASAALQALALDALDPSRHRNRILHCAQFLVDNQAADGRWGIGEPVEAPAPLPPPAPPLQRGVRDFNPMLQRPVFPKVEIHRRREGPKEGDSENSLWAAWGLLACHRCGLLPPKETAQSAVETWRDGACDPAAALSCLSIYRYFLGKDWKKDPEVLRAIDRLAALERPKDPRPLVLLERAMIHFDSAKLGGREWFPDGVNALLRAQSPEGGWGGLEETCWAILYLHVPKLPPMIQPDRK
jgi:hypothetical protein